MMAASNMNAKNYSDYRGMQPARNRLRNDSNARCRGAVGSKPVRRIFRGVLPAAALIAFIGLESRLSAAPAEYPLRGKATYAATSTMSDWTGANPKVSGTATWDEGAKTLEAKVIINLTGWDSGSALREKHTAAMFETDKFPKATFAGTAASGAGGGTNVTFKGTLELHGVKRPLDVPGALRIEKDAIVFQGDFVLRLTDYGMTRPSLLGVTVGNEVKVHIDATASSK